MKSVAYTPASAILRPLLRVLIAAGLTEQELLEICARQVQHVRKTLGRQRLRPLEYEGPGLERIISRWITDTTFLDEGGPAVLNYSGRRSFKVLVRRASVRMSPQLALRGLRRHRVVSVSRNNQIHLVSRYFPCRAANAVDMNIFAQMTVDFLRTLEFNFLGNPQRGHGLFQRLAHSRSLDPQLAPLFNRYARKQGELLLEAVDDWLARRESPRKKRRKKNIRLGLGVYVINESLR
jgi:hypothetical protein